ncbi:hypothetical protein WKI72_00265 [Candidatus Erwinia dacicola]
MAFTILPNLHHVLRLYSNCRVKVGAKTGMIRVFVEIICRVSTQRQKCVCSGTLILAT